MKSTEEKAIVKDMQLASLEVLRKTAHDVYHEKIVGSKLGMDVIDSLDDSNGDSASFRKNNTNGVNGHSDNILLKIDEEDLVFGRVIGRGAFCVVRECFHSSFAITNTSQKIPSGSNHSFEKHSFLGKFARSFKLRRKRKSGNNESPLGASSSSVGSASRSNGYRPGRRLSTNNNRARYVVKQLSSELKREDKINFLKGTVDLALETRFLALLDHENIVTLVGVSNKGAFSDAYFIILEKLNETLGRRVKVWMDMDRQCKGITGVFTGSKKKAQRLQTERISAALSLVAGMDFLHQRNVVFRDLVRL